MIKFTNRIGLIGSSGKILTSWVKLLPLGERLDYHGRKIDFTSEYLGKLVSETQRLNAYFDKKAGAGTPYRQPIWREHRGATETDGSVDDVRLADRAGFNGVWVKLTRTPDAQAAISSGKIKYVSAGIVPEYKVESGETFGPVIREVSLTADPFLKGIGTIQDSLTVQLSHPLSGAQLSMIDEETMEELKAAIAALQAAANAVADAIEGVDAAQEEPEKEQSVEASQPAPTPAPAPNLSNPAPPAPVNLAAQIAEIEKFNALLETKNKLTERAIKLDNLNLTESGHQGDGEPAPVDLSYAETIEKIMKDRGCSRLAAVEFQLKQ